MISLKIANGTYGMGGMVERNFWEGMGSKLLPGWRNLSHITDRFVVGGDYANSAPSATSQEMVGEKAR
jgi:hypothetical protein